MASGSPARAIASNQFRSLPSLAKRFQSVVPCGWENRKMFSVAYEPRKKDWNPSIPSDKSWDVKPQSAADFNRLMARRPEKSSSNRSSPIAGMAAPGGNLSEFVNTTFGVLMPRVLWETVWKPEDFEGIVVGAVQAGYKGLDTSGEPGIREALATLKALGVNRSSVFIQAKLNPLHAANDYPGESIKRQVELTILNTLIELGTDYVDSLLLHAPDNGEPPYPTHNETMKAWRAMEEAVRNGFARQLGISNVMNHKELRKIYADAELKPAVLQQQEFTGDIWTEAEIRSWCAQEGIYFQSIWVTISARYGRLMARDQFNDMADKYGVAPRLLVVRYLLGKGVLPLVSQGGNEGLAAAWSVPLAEEDSATIDAIIAEADEEVAAKAAQMWAQRAEEGGDSSSDDGARPEWQRPAPNWGQYRSGGSWE